MQFLTRAVDDQMGRRVEVPVEPQRIVSLVPSQTELLVDLGIGDRLIGVTDFCTEPADGLEHVARIGGTKRFNFERIDALSPDLIIGNLEENYEEGIARLAERYPVWMSDIYTLADNSRMLREVGALVGKLEAAEKLVQQIEKDFGALPRQPLGRAAYLIWRKPWMVAAANTFIDAMLGHAGLDNVFASQQRYPAVTLEQIAAQNPDVVLLSSEPFPFNDEHVAEMSEAVPGARVIVVDAMPFSWYGSRMRLAPAYFRQLRQRLAVAGNA